MLTRPAPTHKLELYLLRGHTKYRPLSKVMGGRGRSGVGFA